MLSVAGNLLVDIWLRNAAKRICRDQELADIEAEEQYEAYLESSQDNEQADLARDYADWLVAHAQWDAEAGVYKIGESPQ